MYYCDSRTANDGNKKKEAFDWLATFLRTQLKVYTKYF